MDEPLYSGSSIHSFLNGLYNLVASKSIIFLITINVYKKSLRVIYSAEMMHSLKNSFFFKTFVYFKYFYLFLLWILSTCRLRLLLLVNVELHLIHL